MISNFGKMPEKGGIYASKLVDLCGIIPVEASNNLGYCFKLGIAEELYNQMKKQQDVKNIYVLLKYIGDGKYLELYSHSAINYYSDVSNLEIPEKYSFEKKYGENSYLSAKKINLLADRFIKNPLGVKHTYSLKEEEIKDILEMNMGYEKSITEYINSVSNASISELTNFKETIGKRIIRDRLYKEALLAFDKMLKEYGVDDLEISISEKPKEKVKISYDVNSINVKK